MICNAHTLTEPVSRKSELAAPLYLALFSVGMFTLVPVWIWDWGFVVPGCYLLLWSTFDLRMALFLLAGLSVAQGKVGILAHTGANVIIDDIIFAELFLPLFMISYCLRSLKDEPRQLVWHRNVTETILLLFIFVLWVLVCINFIDWKVRAYTQLFHIVVGFIYLILFSTLSIEELHFFFKTMLFWGVVYFVMGLLCISGVILEFDALELTKIFRLKLEFFSGGKRASLLAPPAVTSVTLGLFAFASYLLGYLHRRFRYWIYSAAFLTSVGIFYTRTRSEMVAFLFAGFTLTALFSWKRNFLLRGLTLCLVYVLIVWAVAAGFDLASALKRIQVSTDTAEQASLGIRLGLWKEGLIDLAKTRGVGVGTGGFFEYKDQWPHAHNVYFSVLFDLGVVGFVLWLLFYFNLWRLALIALKRIPYLSKEWALLAFLTAFYVELSLTSLLQHEFRTFIWWMFPGIFLAAINSALKKYQPSF